MTTESWNMRPHPPKEEAEAKKYTGASSKILRGEQQLPFARGDFGAVVQEKITMTRGSKERERDLVTKYFKELSGSDSPEASMVAYELLKKAGVKHIPTTYRQVGPNEIIMTDYNRGGKVAVSKNLNAKAEGLRIDSISNISKLLASMSEDIQHASNARIKILDDSYFFIIPISGSGRETHVDFVIGDFGGVIQSGEDKAGTYTSNISLARSALLSFVSRHVTDTKERREENERPIFKWWTDSVKDADALANEAMDRGASS